MDEKDKTQIEDLEVEELEGAEDEDEDEEDEEKMRTGESLFEVLRAEGIIDRKLEWDNLTPSTQRKYRKVTETIS